MQGRKSGLANPYTSLMGVRYDRKAISGITELSRLRARIDDAACYFIVGSSHPGCAAAAKGTGVHWLKRFASWVHNVVRQLVLYPLEMLRSEGKDPLVREEQGFEASGDLLSDKAGRAATP